MLLTLALEVDVFKAILIFCHRCKIRDGNNECCIRLLRRVCGEWKRWRQPIDIEDRQESSDKIEEEDQAGAASAQLRNDERDVWLLTWFGWRSELNLTEYILLYDMGKSI